MFFHYFQNQKKNGRGYCTTNVCIQPSRSYKISEDDSSSQLSSTTDQDYIENNIQNRIEL